MPLLYGQKNIGKNISELKADNQKSGKAKGAERKPRPMKQIVAIALSAAGIKKKGSPHDRMFEAAAKKSSKGK